MSDREQKEAMGRRLKAAAEALGLSAPDVAERLNTSETTVYRWWSGERSPRKPMLGRYAELVGRAVEELSGERDEVARVLLMWANELMAGRPADQALEADGGKVSPETRKRLRERTDHFRKALIEKAGPGWFELTDDQRQAVLEDIRQRALENRRGVSRAAPAPATG